MSTEYRWCAQVCLKSNAARISSEWFLSLKIGSAENANNWSCRRNLGYNSQRLERLRVRNKGCQWQLARQIAVQNQCFSIVANADQVNFAWEHQGIGRFLRLSRPPSRAQRKSRNDVINGTNDNITIIFLSKIYLCTKQTVPVKRASFSSSVNHPPVLVETIGEPKLVAWIFLGARFQSRPPKS